MENFKIDWPDLHFPPINLWVVYSAKWLIKEKEVVYKDKTFCDDWCLNRECHRNIIHVEEAQKEGGVLHQNPWMPIAFLVSPPPPEDNCGIIPK